MFSLTTIPTSWRVDVPSASEALAEPPHEPGGVLDDHGRDEADDPVRGVVGDCLVVFAADPVCLAEDGVGQGRVVVAECQERERVPPVGEGDRRRLDGGVAAQFPV
jgi:hypothetical protein